MALRISLAVLLLLVGTGLLLITAVAVIDPVGAKMADDGDPLGSTADAWKTNLIFTLIGIGMIVGGIELLRSLPTDARPNSTDQSNRAG